MNPKRHRFSYVPRTAFNGAALVVVAAILQVRAQSLDNNLLPNGSFERDADRNGIPDGWEDVQAGENGRCVLDRKVVRDGGASLRIIHESSSPDWVRVSVSNLRGRPRRLMFLGGWVRATGPWQIILYEFPRDPKKNYLTHEIAAGAAGDWKRVGRTVRTASDVKTFKVSLITRGKGEAWFDDFVLTDLERPPLLRVPALSRPPKVDGSLGDDAWQMAATLGPFWKLGGNGERATVPTAVRIGFTGKVLYVSWQCSEPKMDRLADRKPGDPSWNDDTVELFLAPAADVGGYWHLGVTPSGGRLGEVKTASGKAYAVDWYSARATHSARKALVLPDWNAAVQSGKGGWTVEMAIRLDAFPRALRPGAVWRLQFARSRKVTGSEQNSCWAFTPGTTFHAPQHFGRAAPPLWSDARPTVVQAPARPAAAAVRIVPNPRQMSVLDQPPRELRNTVRIAVLEPTTPNPASRALRRDLERLGLNVRFAPLSAAAASDFLLAPPDSPAVPAEAVRELRKRMASLPKWQAREAYALDTSRRPAVLAASGARGLFYAVQSVRQLVRSAGATFALPAVRITDWPALQWRGWHLISPERAADVDAAKRVIDVLAALKMNWIALQIDNRLQYTGDPQLGREGAPTKAQLRSLVRYAEDRLMEVIPMTQCWSHFGYFLGKPKYRGLAEIPDPDPGARVKYWNYCPRNPETHKLLFGMIKEQLECFPNAKYFHCGLDEIRFEPIGVCPRCKGTPGDVLMAEEVNRLHAFLKTKGLTMCMWGDQLLPEHNGGPPYNTAKAISRIPQDIVVFDWHYAPAEDYPSVGYFKEHGFPVVASGWYEPLNVMNLSRTAFRQNVLGYGGTTWYNIARIRDEVRLITAMPLAAENTWSPQHPVLADMEYLPADVFRELWREKPGPSPREFALIDLRPWANRTLGDDDRELGVFGLGDENDLRSLPTGRRWFAGVPFDIIGPGRRQCIVLAKDGDQSPAFPERAWPIPVNTRAQALAFLQTCTHPDRFSRHIYDRRKVNPGDVVEYVVTYADGSTVRVRCRWNREIADWNSQLGSAWGRTAWTGRTRAGALIRIESFEWSNPHPEKVIATLEAVSLETTVRPILFAVTAIR
ncbi:MAG: family 20 glycosylhydrolase [Kiritimatiellaeota bacterium]|nr:family 20 glycosylhydrolase [Kiritimatiellota bacterium]